MRTVFLIVCCLTFCGLSWAQDAREKFKAQFYAPSVITTHSIGAERFNTLSAASRSDLLLARKTLIAFFAAVEKSDGDPRVYLAPDFSAKYQDISELINKLLGQETTVMSVGVSDYSMQADGIQLDFYVVLFGEGVVLARDGTAKLKRIGGSWKLVQIGEFS